MNGVQWGCKMHPHDGEVVHLMIDWVWIDLFDENAAQEDNQITASDFGAK